LHPALRINAAPAALVFQDCAVSKQKQHSSLFEYRIHNTILERQAAVERDGLLVTAFVNAGMDAVRGIPIEAALRHLHSFWLMHIPNFLLRCVAFALSCAIPLLAIAQTPNMGHMQLPQVDGGLTSVFYPTRGAEESAKGGRHSVRNEAFA
jgi:hypothetical protein